LIPSALDRLAELVAAADDPWLTAAYERFLAGEPLDRALGLDRTSLARLARARRDHHLRQAAELLAPDCTPWPRACRLAAEIRRFESVCWPRWRDLAAVPAGTSELRKHLWHAAHTGVALPELRQLHRILSSPALAMSEAPDYP
jgi:hypothetical protein